MVDLRREYAAIGAEIDAAVRAVFASGRMVRGEAVEEFERSFAACLGVRSVVMVSSGTAALHAALVASGVGSGDEVIVPAMTFVATAEAVAAAGGVPVVVDVDPGTLLMDVGAALRAVGPRTRAAVPVHVFGQVHPRTAELASELRGRGIGVVEDACQAHGGHSGGRRPASGTTAACYSFYPGKNLGTYGEGGAVATNDEAVAARVRSLRDHGSSPAGAHVEAGLNLWPGEVEAAVLSVKLPHLDRWNGLRRGTAARYDEVLSGSRSVRPLRNDGGSGHAFHEYVVRAARRDRLREMLAERGIDTAIHYASPLDSLPWVAARARIPEPCVEAGRASREVLSLPVHHWMTGDESARCASALAEAAGSLDAEDGR